MIQFVLQQPRMLLALFGVVLVVLVAIIGLWSDRRARTRFFGAATQRSWAVTGSRWWRWGRIACAGLGAACVVLALARPSSDPKPQPVQRVGRDVMFVLDVSRSMLAQDVRPSRLERAKLGVRDAIDVAEGDRIGLIAFAGSAVLKSPLTSDYSFIRMALDDTTPGSVGRGGTAIGDAIRSAVAILRPESSDAETNPKVTSEKDRADRSKTIVLITDGEDHETNPLAAAKAAAEKGIRIVTIGVGSELDGAAVPLPPQLNSRGVVVEQRGVATIEGREVRSRMDPSTLRQIAEATPGGMFLNVGTGNIDLDALYRQLLRTSGPRIEEKASTIRYTEWFQVALALAIALLSVEMLLHARGR